jgi:hypothetical protein
LRKSRPHSHFYDIVIRKSVSPQQDQVGVSSTRQRHIDRARQNSSSDWTPFFTTKELGKATTKVFQIVGLVFPLPVPSIGQKPNKKALKKVAPATFAVSGK